ncbi:hypothetical protein LAZ67_8002359 [Cordylochernes scorpioides]|uniref:DUF5641 domain-containing protein n=1 Tax=Cordylochernes scorpioides TaxID=51811 RepID=A0ABY6KSF2_9ARAC|nr:hypothetical protein LAZ67_8002359 [Cordylochernes scorpioides]
MSSSASPGSSGSAGQEPGRPSIPAPTGGRISSENGNQKILKENSENRVYANPPAGVKDANLAAARDVTLNLPAEARARQASSSEEHCVYLEHGPELQPFHYLRALDRLLGGTAGIIQISKVNGHQLLGLANRGLAERLINNGLEVEGTLLRAFPFRKRAERITVSNLPFFVEDSAIINALRPFGRITSIAPKMMKAGPYTYTDGRREAFIVLHEGMTTERLPTRLDITIKGEAWPAYLSTGIKCSRCHGQGHRRANCPLLAGLANNTRTAPPTTPAGVPPPTTPAPPQRSAAQPPAPTPSNPAMEVCSAPPVARAALHSSAPRPSPPAAPAFPMEEMPPAPPPVTPAPSLQTPGSREPAAPTPDVEMSIVEETLASFTSSAKNATRVDLDAFIEGHPSVSFAKTDALGLGREEVLDLLSSRTKAQRKGPLLSPPQCDALVGLIGQILDLRPGAASNLYKVLGKVKAELRTTPAVPPTPTLPAPWPSKPTPPALHGEKTSPDIATPPPPLSTEFIDACYDQANDIIYELSDERYSEPLSDIGVTEGDIVEAIIFPDDREPLLRRLSTQKRTTLAGIVSAASERARSSDPFVREGLRILSEMLPPQSAMIIIARIIMAMIIMARIIMAMIIMARIIMAMIIMDMKIMAMIIMVGRSRRLLLLYPSPVPAARRPRVASPGPRLGTQRPPLRGGHRTLDPLRWKGRTSTHWSGHFPRIRPDASSHNPAELAYAQVSKIFSLREIKNPSAKCLHEFMDVCNEAIRNLETLELKRNQLVDVILVHFLQQKLSENLRTYPVAITADIEKMYRQIRIHPEDADYQRILWRPSPEEPVVDYRLLTWRLARILEVYPGSDQKVRVAQVRAATRVYLRPITKLAPLPFKSEPGFSGRGEYSLVENQQRVSSDTTYLVIYEEYVDCVICR